MYEECMKNVKGSQGTKCKKICYKIKKKLFTISINHVLGKMHISNQTEKKYN